MRTRRVRSRPGVLAAIAGFVASIAVALPAGALARARPQAAPDLRAAPLPAWQYDYDFVVSNADLHLAIKAQRAWAAFIGQNDPPSVLVSSTLNAFDRCGSDGLRTILAPDNTGRYALELPGSTCFRPGTSTVNWQPFVDAMSSGLDARLASPTIERLPGVRGLVGFESRAWAEPSRPRAVRLELAMPGALDALVAADPAGFRWLHQGALVANSATGGNATSPALRYPLKVRGPDSVRTELRWRAVALFVTDAGVEPSAALETVLASESTLPVVDAQAVIDS